MGVMKSIREIWIGHWTLCACVTAGVQLPNSFWNFFLQMERFNWNFYYKPSEQFFLSSLSFCWLNTYGISGGEMHLMGKALILNNFEIKIDQSVCHIAPDLFSNYSYGIAICEIRLMAVIVP